MITINLVPRSYQTKRTPSLTRTLKSRLLLGAAISALAAVIAVASLPATAFAEDGSSESSAPLKSRSSNAKAKAKKAARKAKAKSAGSTNTSSTVKPSGGKLSRDVVFDGSVVNGKYLASGEAVSTVENEKSLNNLIGMRADFKDRLGDQRAQLRSGTDK